MYENNNNTKKRLIIIGIVVIVILIVGISLAAGGNGKNNVKQQTTGTVTLHYNTTDITNAVVKFNGHKATPSNITTSGSATYNVAPNTYKLSITDPGYTSFSTSFSVNKNQTIVVNVHIQIVVNEEPTITSISQIPFPTGTDTTNATITSIAYFNNNVWAVVVFQTDGNIGIVVTQYNAQYGSWETLLGPGTTFTTDSLQGIPQNVQDYLTANNYVNPEGE
jgi:flagellar basal body-associated protein FliL